MGVGTNLGELGKGDVVLIVAADVEETAPVYMLRLKAAAERGAKLMNGIVACGTLNSW